MNKFSPPLFLASKSPRRAELLRQLNLNFQVIAADVSEERQSEEPVLNFVKRIAEEKARAGLASGLVNNAIVLGADTVVTMDKNIFGKPQSYQDYVQMLSKLSGNTHQVFTGICVASDEYCKTAVSVSDVSMRHISHSEIEAYWNTGEPEDKAGGYAIQGQAAIWISHLSGSYSGVMGLPLFETAQLLAAANVNFFPEPIAGN